MIRLALLGMTSSLVFAQALPDPYSTLITYGPLGIFVMLYLTGQLVSKRELERANARADRAEAQRDALSDRAMSDVLPLVNEVARTMVPTVDRLVTQVQRMADRLDQLDRSVRGG